jgi:hypothetical protein
MIARAAERNPSCFLPTKALDTTTVVIPRLIRICNHLSNPFSSTKFLLTQFHATPSLSPLTKAESKVLHNKISSAPDFWTWGQVFNVDLGGATQEQAGKDGYVIPGETTEEVLRPVVEGMAKRVKERESGGLALGGEHERELVERLGEMEGEKVLEGERVELEKEQEVRPDGSDEESWRDQVEEEEQALNEATERADENKADGVPPV